MNFIAAVETDIGIKRKTNQDSMAVLTANSKIGDVALAVMCDGMGGLAKGELASSSLVRAFEEWFEAELPKLIDSGITDQSIKSSWTALIDSMNNNIKNYGKQAKINLGTTVTAVLICPNRYYCINVGDSRTYSLSKNINQITEDQTVVEKEIKYGRLTRQEAKIDPRKSVLLQCVGASDVIQCDMFFGDIKPKMAFLLCSDGFRNQITDDEMFNKLNPERVFVQADISIALRDLIETCKARTEKDNISAIMIKIV